MYFKQKTLSQMFRKSKNLTDKDSCGDMTLCFLLQEMEIML